MRLSYITLCLYVLFTKGLVAPAGHVTGPLNGTIVLPCTYSSWPTTMCWGRGTCPNSKCDQEIIWTDGRKVTWRKSDRYQLLGDISQGDVSMTIIGATKEDEGTYCCRVEIPGWLNDLKIERTVEIQEAPSPPEPTDWSSHTTQDLQSTYETLKATSAHPLPSTVTPASQVCVVFHIICNVYRLFGTKTQPSSSGFQIVKGKVKKHQVREHWRKTGPKDIAGRGGVAEDLLGCRDP
ncbi:hepatitis A virus cellular receptor 1 homolog [Leptodactylus fuscus]|uniref:hepatitis A virus cellular receptor 1 homolog n=1 Tax=Leptodactylus fuscus TaxID=238119 RepID=UPI003F4EA359